MRHTGEEDDTQRHDTRRTREEHDIRHRGEEDDTQRHDIRQQRYKRREITDIIQDEITDIIQDMKH